jgi:hypothetical protein
LLGEEQKWLAHARYDAIELGCVKTRKPEKGRERLFSAQPKSNALINLQACKRDLEERLFYRRRWSPRFYTAKALSRHRERPSECPLPEKADVTRTSQIGRS